MALIKCKECGHKVSKKAETCPSCGAPVKKKTSSLQGSIHKLLAAIILGVLLIWGCGTCVENLPESGTTQKPNKPKKSDQPTSTSIPKDVTYTIIDETRRSPIKRKLDIRLNRKVSQEVLKSIAMKLKSSDSKSYERTFIFYHLPGIKVGGGCWATTHFNPNLEVKVQGLTVEQERAFKQLSDDPSREVVGNWLNDRPFIGNRTTIFRQDGKLFIEKTYTDGSIGKEELTKSESPLGQCFERVEGSDFGDHWILDSKGNLQLWDKEGLIATFKKID